MSDMRCALIGPDSTVQNVVVCCGGDPAKCSLAPTRIKSSDGAVGPGYTYVGGAFQAPPAPESTQTVVAASAPPVDTGASLAAAR